MTGSITWLKSVRYCTKEIAPQDSCESVTDRQERVPGFNQSVMDNLQVLQIGAGGLGGEIAQGLVRKGVGALRIFDGDAVSVSNLSRQFFYEEDLYQNKAICLARNLVKEGTGKTLITAHPFMIQKAMQEKMDVRCNIVICAPDNDDARIYVAKHFCRKVPVIFTGLDREASTGYVFIQVPKGACFACAFPNSIEEKREQCPHTPAIIDLVKIIAGFVLFAIDSVVMQRKTNWNYRQVFIAGFVPENVRKVERKLNCPLCGSVKVRSNGKQIHS